MSEGIYAALSGAIAAGRSLEVVANNVANVNTTGFKKDRLSFREVLAGTNTTQRQVQIEPNGVDMRPGPTKRTDSPLDVAIIGPGFFAVQTPEGERYTRAGAFVVSANGELSTPSGHPVLGTAGPIKLEAGASVTIGADGTVTSNNNQVGQLRTVDFADAQSLERTGANLWRSTGPEPSTVPTTLEPGAIELSNVNAIEGMTELIMISRAYEGFNKCISNYRDIDQRTATELGR